jgi:hypothetical protein
VEGDAKYVCSLLALCACFLLAPSASTQQNGDPGDVPFHFKLDMESAARQRPKLFASSTEASGRYATCGPVFARLVEQVHNTSGLKFAWQLRIIPDNQLNAFSSPDGTVYVESGLAKLAGSSAGLWAAVLSHEIAHVVHRDWARRYLYQRSLHESRGFGAVLGDPSRPEAQWNDSEKTSEDMARFSRRVELEADREGLMLMARAGYHPDFVPALHHLLHAEGVGSNRVSLYALHPCWEERDRELAHAYVVASIEFECRWPEWYASPGGNPPIVVFAEDPKARKTSGGWQLQFPMRCENLAGAVEVVVRSSPDRGTTDGVRRFADSAESGELRQLTGCTSPRTTVVFAFENHSDELTQTPAWTDIYVVDASGSVLARADMPRIPH